MDYIQTDTYYFISRPTSEKVRQAGLARPGRLYDVIRGRSTLFRSLLPSHSATPFMGCLFFAVTGSLNLYLLCKEYFRFGCGANYQINLESWNWRHGNALFKKCLSFRLFKWGVDKQTFLSESLWFGSNLHTLSSHYLQYFVYKFTGKPCYWLQLSGHVCPYLPMYWFTHT